VMKVWSLNVRMLSHQTKQTIKPTKSSRTFCNIFIAAHKTFLHFLGQLFSDLASKNTELLASLASVLKKLINTFTKGVSTYGRIHNAWCRRWRRGSRSRSRGVSQYTSPLPSSGQRNYPGRFARRRGLAWWLRVQEL
jgi:hypothetical protein